MTDAFHKDCQIFTEAGHTSQLTAYYESARRIVWLMMHTHPRPSFNPALLDDVEAVFRAVCDSKLPIDFFISGSTVPHMYNTGGDLSLFSQAIRQRQRDVLSSYATRCIDILCHLDGGFGRNVITLALVEGSALGGGFEAALAHHYLLVQRDAKMGFPEISFNLFPGMGAYSFVGRKAGQRVAEQLISSGEAPRAPWHHEVGLADQLFEPGEGVMAARTFIDTLQPRMNGIRAMLRARHRVFPIHREELMDITQDWVDTALSVEDKDIAYMERLVQLQNKRTRT